MTESVQRCWGDEDAVMATYHDDEWGVPVHDDRTHFEFLLLDNFQAGLSWRTILHRRPGFKAAFADFDPVVVAEYDAAKMEDLRNDVGIIRNRLKIAAAVTNAQAFLRIQDEFGTFDKYIWQFTNHSTIVHSNLTSLVDFPATSVESDAMSKDLKQHGFKFVGSTICYAYMQSIGMVYDHMVGCHRYGREF